MASYDVILEMQREFNLWITYLQLDDIGDMLRMRRVNILASFILKHGCPSDLTTALHQLALRTVYDYPDERQVLIGLLRVIEASKIKSFFNVQLLHDTINDSLGVSQAVFVTVDKEHRINVLKHLVRNHTLASVLGVSHSSGHVDVAVERSYPSLNFDLDVVRVLVPEAEICDFQPPEELCKQIYLSPRKWLCCFFAR